LKDGFKATLPQLYLRRLSKTLLGDPTLDFSPVEEMELLPNHSDIVVYQLFENAPGESVTLVAIVAYSVDANGLEKYVIREVSARFGKIKPDGNSSSSGRK
jgi:hypothetical protein